MRFTFHVRRVRPCVVFSSETENRGAGEGGAGNVGSDEDNNWGMDDNIDVNAVRMLLLM